MGLRNTLDRLSTSFGPRGRLNRYRALYDMVDRFLYTPDLTTASAPHIRDSTSVQRVMMYFVIASVPCWLIGLCNMGYQANSAMAALDIGSIPGWRGSGLEALGVGISPASISDCFLQGFSYWVPIVGASLLIGGFWEVLFANLRRKTVDHGLLTTAWLFALILPPATPLYQVVLGMSFGIVVGKLIFGGTGRNPVNPAVLGAAFLFIAYPDLVFSPGARVPVIGFDTPTALEHAAEGGLAAMSDAGFNWWQLFLGVHTGALGVTSTLGCVIGASFLLITGMASLRIILGSVLGLIGALVLFDLMSGADVPMLGVPWYWHAVLGGFAFGTAFLATDPVTSATTNAGRWAVGVFVGFVTIIIRLAEPTYNEAVLYAILLAAVFAPTFDFVAVELNVRRRHRQLREAP